MFLTVRATDAAAAAADDDDDGANTVRSSTTVVYVTMVTRQQHQQSETAPRVVPAQRWYVTQRSHSTISICCQFVVQHAVQHIRQTC